MNEDTPRTNEALIDNADLTDWGTGKSIPRYFRTLEGYIYKVLRKDKDNLYWVRMLSPDTGGYKYTYALSRDTILSRPSVSPRAIRFFKQDGGYSL